VVGFVVGEIDGAPALEGPLLGLILGITLGVFFGIIEVFVTPRYYLRFSHFGLNSLRFLVYLVMVFVGLTIANVSFIMIDESEVLVVALNRYVMEETVIRDGVLGIIITIIAITIMQMRRLHNPGEIIGLLTGKYHYPEQQTRVVMFADLVGSTSMTERLTPVMSSRFIRDFFSDISEAILAWDGQVYQYLGDRGIITWPVSGAKGTGKSIQCYFEMCRLLRSKAAHYESEFGEAPHVRVGLHCGPVVATWVGEAKRELALHGETLHISARIESLCKEYEKDCIISDSFLQSQKIPSEFRIRDLGSVTLRGREAEIRLYSVIEDSRRRET